MRLLPGLAGISVGEGSRVVGPLYIRSAALLVIGRGAWAGHDCFVVENGHVFIGSYVMLRRMWCSLLGDTRQVMRAGAQVPE